MTQRDPMDVLEAYSSVKPWLSRKKEDNLAVVAWVLKGLEGCNQNKKKLTHESSNLKTHGGRSSCAPCIMKWKK